MKYDLHVHSNNSFDGVHTPEEMVREAKKIGLDGIAFTAHMNCDDWKEIPKLKKKYKIEIIEAEEIIVLQGKKIAGEIIGLYMKKPIKKFLRVESAIKELKKQNALAILAHPFGFEMKNIEKYNFDALETLNGRRNFKRFKKVNEKAKEFAEKYDFAQTGGSDAHTYFEIGTAITDTGKLNLREAIKKKRTKPVVMKRNLWPLQLKIDLMRGIKLKKNHSKNPVNKLSGC